MEYCTPGHLLIPTIEYPSVYANSWEIPLIVLTPEIQEIKGDFVTSGGWSGMPKQRKPQRRPGERKIYLLSFVCPS
jgi:hypothetical protein